MNGGYAMIDCGGLNLLGQSAVTIAGLYKKVGAAFNAGKPILACNCVYGEGVTCTPFSVMVINEAGTYICTASILQVRVASNDSVTITPLLNATKGGK